MTCLLAILRLKLFFNTFLLTVLYLGTFSRAVSMHIQPCWICVHSVGLELLRTSNGADLRNWHPGLNTTKYTLFFTVSERMIQHHLASVNCLNSKARGVVTDWTIFCQVAIDPLRGGFDIFLKMPKFENLFDHILLGGLVVATMHFKADILFFKAGRD